MVLCYRKGMSGFETNDFRDKDKLKRNLDTNLCMCTISPDKNIMRLIK